MGPPTPRDIGSPAEPPRPCRGPGPPGPAQMCLPHSPCAWEAGAQRPTGRASRIALHAGPAGNWSPESPREPLRPLPQNAHKPTWRAFRAVPRRGKPEPGNPPKRTSWDTCESQRSPGRTSRTVRRSPVHQDLPRSAFRTRHAHGKLEPSDPPGEPPGSRFTQAPRGNWSPESPRGALRP